MVPKSCFQWVDHLVEQSCITSSNKCNAKKLKKIKIDRRLPQKIKRTKKVDLQTRLHITVFSKEYFLPIYSNFSIPAVILSIPVMTAVICSQ